MGFGVHLSFYHIDTRWCIHRKLLILYLIDGRPNQKIKPKKFGMSATLGDWDNIPKNSSKTVITDSENGLQLR